MVKDSMMNQYPQTELENQFSINLRIAVRINDAHPGTNVGEVYTSSKESLRQSIMSLCVFVRMSYTVLVAVQVHSSTDNQCSRGSP